MYIKLGYKGLQINRGRNFKEQTDRNVKLSTTVLLRTNTAQKSFSHGDTAKPNLSIPQTRPQGVSSGYI